MRALLDRLSRHPLATLAGCVVYVALMFGTHDLVQDLAYALQRAVTPAVWGPLVGVIALLSALGLGAAAWRRLRAAPGGGAVHATWWGSLAACGGASAVLLATNMEIVHFVQYALLAVPVYALTRRLGASLLLLVLIGAADEWTQYHVLHRGWAVRYDVNDVVLNACGAALGLAAVLVFARAERRTADAPPPDARRLWTPVLAVALLFGALPPALLASHRLAMYRNEACPATWVVLSRHRRPEARWVTPEWGRSHHVLHPAGALAACLVLLTAFTATDRLVHVPQREERTS